MNIGDYIRTNTGIIGKIIDMKIEDDFLIRERYGDRIYLDNNRLCLTEDIIKSSPNIIDLIKVGDLIKLYSTKQIQQVLFKNENEIDLTDYVFYDLKEASFIDEIEWIITHEQIEQMKYKIGDDK